MTTPIHFLTYLNRSGSTLLAKKLSQYPDIGVGYEVDYERAYAGKMPTFPDRSSLNEFLDTMYQDPKFPSWSPQRSILESALENLPFPLAYRDLLGKVFDLYFQDGPRDCYIHKAGAFFRFLPAFRRTFPDSLFICIVRDPRAVFNSQQKSISTRTSKPMQSDVTRFALRYRQDTILLGRELKQKDLLIVKYEDLLQDENETLNRVIDFLGVRSRRNVGDNHYFDKIPQGQKHLHTSVKDKNDSGRIQAWKQELAPPKIRFLEIILKRDMDSLGYNNNSHTSLSLLEWWLLGGVLIRYFTSPAYVRGRLRGDLS